MRRSRHVRGRSGRSVRKVRLAAVFLILVLTAGIWVHILDGVTDLLGGPKSLDEIAVKEYDSQYIETRIGFVLDCFTEYVKKKKDGSEEIQWLYYIIPAGNNPEKYMAVRVGTEAGIILDQVCDETWEHLFGGAEPETEYVLTGKLKRMNEEELRYYYEWFKEAGFTQAETEEFAVPYVIMDGLVGGKLTSASTPRTVVISFAVSLILFLAAVFCLLKELTGRR